MGEHLFRRELAGSGGILLLGHTDGRDQRGVQRQVAVLALHEQRHRVEVEHTLHQRQRHPAFDGGVQGSPASEVGLGGQ